jgi:hypothetical protein
VQETVCLIYVPSGSWSLRHPISYKGIPSYCVYDIMSGETSLVSIEGAPYMEHCIPGWLFTKKLSNEYNVRHFFLSKVM